MFSEQMWFYLVFFVVLFTASFKLGRIWEAVEQEEQKKKATVRHITNKWR